MQAPDGNIVFFDEDEFPSIAQQLQDGLVPMTNDDLRETVNMNKTKRKNWMRNKPCICGSGKKFKKCCWYKYSGAAKEA